MLSQTNNLHESQTKKMTLLGFSILFMVLDRQWGFVYTHTIFSSTIVIYIVFITLLVLFLSVATRYGMGKMTKISAVWTPYLVYTLLGYFFSLNLQNVSYWLICLVLIMVASKTSVINVFPGKFLFFSGIIALIGVYFQLFSPSLYNSTIPPLFIRSDVIEMWTESFGLNGFTYQVGTTALILLYGEVAFLYFFKNNIKNKFISNIIVAAFIIGVFLTGKRLLSVIALIIPFLVFFLSNKISTKRIGLLLLLMVTIIGAYVYFVDNVYRFEDTRFLHRFAVSYIDSRSGNDITSGRSYLYDMAYKAYKTNPVFGIGVGKFISYTGAETDVHNTYLQVLCEQGIVGIVLYVLSLLYCLLYTIKRTPRYRNTPYFIFIQISLALQFIHIIYGFTGNVNVGGGFFMYALALALLISAESTNFVFNTVN